MYAPQRFAVNTSTSAHHASPQAPARLADRVLISVKSLLKTVNWQHQKGACFNITQLQNALADDTTCQEITCPNHAWKCNRPQAVWQNPVFIDFACGFPWCIRGTSPPLFVLWQRITLPLLPCSLSNFTYDSFCNWIFHLLHGPVSMFLRHVAMR